MAVAPVAVEMRPRNRRRLTTSAVVLGVGAVVVAFGLWLFDGLRFTHSPAQSDKPVQSRHLTLIPDNLSYGLTRQQVLHRLGRPDKIAGNCWQYPENKTNFVGQKINAVRLCFLSNSYTIWYQELDGKWRDPSSSRPVIPPPTFRG